MKIRMPENTPNPLIEAGDLIAIEVEGRTELLLVVQMDPRKDEVCLIWLENGQLYDKYNHFAHIINSMKKHYPDFRLIKNCDVEVIIRR